MNGGTKIVGSFVILKFHFQINVMFYYFILYECPYLN